MPHWVHSQCLILTAKSCIRMVIRAHLRFLHLQMRKRGKRQSLAQGHLCFWTFSGVFLFTSQDASFPSADIASHQSCQQPNQVELGGLFAWVVNEWPFPRKWNQEAPWKMESFKGAICWVPAMMNKASEMSLSPEQLKIIWKSIRAVVSYQTTEQDKGHCFRFREIYGMVGEMKDGTPLMKASPHSSHLVDTNM